MRRYLKKAAPKERSDTEAIESTVRQMLADIAANRDDAIRRYAQTLDHWTKSDFRVSDDEIRDAAARLPETFKEDFNYAYNKVTGFARHQRDSLKELRSRNRAGHLAGPEIDSGSTSVVTFQAANIRSSRRRS